MNSSELLMQASELDSLGNHEAAIKLLLGSAEKGDIEAKTQIGKRMIVGDRAPNLPKDGVGFIVEAAEAGGPEALCLLSVLFALGMYVNQDWQQALNALRISAANYWEDARNQLLAIASDRELVAKREAREADPEYWLQLASSVDFDYWSSPPASKILSEDPLIKIYPNFVNDDVCRWLISKAQGRLTRAQVYDSVKRTVTESHTRTNSAAIFNMVETDLVNLLIQMRMAVCTGVNFRNFEAATVLHYSSGEQISEHYDFIDPNTPDYEKVIREQGQRIITFIIYLNDDYSGGQTEFPELNISHNGSRGEGIFFVNAFQDGSSDLRTLHAGRPPENGEKWIATQFIRNSYAL